MYCISESLGYNRQVPANGVTFVTGLAGSLFIGTLFLHNHRHHLLFPYSPAPRLGASGKPASESSPGSLSPGKGRGALGLCKIDDGTRGNVTSFLKLFCNSAKPRHGREISAGRCRILLRKRNYRAGVYQARAWGNSTGVIVEKGISCGHGTSRCKDKLQMVVQGKPPLTEKDTEVRIESPSVIFQYQSIISPLRRQYTAQNLHICWGRDGPALRESDLPARRTG